MKDSLLVGALDWESGNLGPGSLSVIDFLVFMDKSFAISVLQFPVAQELDPFFPSSAC